MNYFPSSLEPFLFVQDRCLKPCHKLSQRLQSWYRDIVFAYRTCLQLSLALGSLSEMAAWYSQALKTDEEFDSIVGQFITAIKTFPKPPPVSQPAEQPSVAFQASAPPVQVSTSRLLLFVVVLYVYKNSVFFFSIWIPNCVCFFF